MASIVFKLPGYGMIAADSHELAWAIADACDEEMLEEFTEHVGNTSPGL